MIYRIIILIYFICIAMEVQIKVHASDRLHKDTLGQSNSPLAVEQHIEDFNFAVKEFKGSF